MARAVKTETAPTYGKATDTTGKATDTTESDDALIERAVKAARARLRKHGAAMESPHTVAHYVELQLCNLEHEVFCVLLLDNRHRLIDFVQLFRGTIDGASVHPREVVKLVLAHNAAAVILAHNHPSGAIDPSHADERVTNTLRDALALIDVRVLDHIIVGNGTLSFAEKGLI